MNRKLTPGLIALALVLAGALAPASEARVRSCGFGSGYRVFVNSVTTCPFAFNVAAAVRAGNRSPRVYSPVTRRTYRMYCSRRSSRTIVCTGGRGAYVRLTC